MAATSRLTEVSTALGPARSKTTAVRHQHQLTAIPDVTPATSETCRRWNRRVQPLQDNWPGLPSSTSSSTVLPQPTAWSMGTLCFLPRTPSNTGGSADLGPPKRARRPSARRPVPQSGFCALGRPRIPRSLRETVLLRGSRPLRTTLPSRDGALGEMRGCRPLSRTRTSSRRRSQAHHGIEPNEGCVDNVHYPTGLLSSYRLFFLFGSEGSWAAGHTTFVCNYF